MGSEAFSTLGDFVDLIRGTTYQGSLVGKPGPALLGLGAIQPGGGFRDQDFKTYGGDCPSKLMLSPGDLFASLKGATKDGEMIGSVARVPASVLHGRLTQDTVKLAFRHRNSAFEQYVYWLLRTPQCRAYCAGRATGSAVVALSRQDFLAYPVPPLTPFRMHCVLLLEHIERRALLLRQTNAVLESIAQALFKSWFIDFDPVRAKAEGREPEGMDAATAALFPTEFEESALGLIPKGWRAATVADAIEFNPPRSLFKGADARYLEMANASTSGHRPLERVELRAFGSGCKFCNGDGLLAKITPCLENGKSAFVDFLEDGETGWGSTEFIVLRARSVLPNYAAYLLTRHDPFRQFAIQAMTGTSGRQRVELSRLKQFAMALPPDSGIAEAAAPTMVALQSRIAANDECAKSLSDLRDELLPRLVSGKLSLPEMKEKLEEAIA